MFRGIPVLLLSLSPLIALAQDAVILKNTGEPIRVPFTCAEDELQAVGLLCTEAEPCAIYLELNAAAPAGKKIFVGGDLHATSGTVTSILLTSDDGGATWKEPANRIRGAALDQLQIYDLEHGWSAGEIQYPLPSDPFFLVTSDGGQTWRKRPVSDEGGPGSIQRFWFDSAKHGELVVDAGRSAAGGRYVTWESETGGDSWDSRAATAQIPVLKRAPPDGVADVRIQADASGKSYRIERRTGESTWEPVASFLIETAACPMKETAH
jgi:photosystem II stability/assembly factor-like uncharacterized protein